MLFIKLTGFGILYAILLKVLTDENRPVFRYSAGYADIKSKKLVTSDNLYNLYSATKVITCAAALQLFEKGRLLMSNPVSEYLPEFREMKIRRVAEHGEVELIKAENSLKIRDLFMMTAGLIYDLNRPPIRAVKI